MTHWMNSIRDKAALLLQNLGIPQEWVPYCRGLIFIILLATAAFIAFYITKRLAAKFLGRLSRKNSFAWAGSLNDLKAFRNLAHVASAVITRLMAPAAFADFNDILPFIIRSADAYLVIAGMNILFIALKTGEHNLSRHPAFRDKPLTSYFQLIRIIFCIVTIILVLSIILGESPVYFLSAFGAMTAILLLVFKDTILGLVASVQMSSNDMVRVGDWVEMPKFNADGDVLDINLNTVKIQNWDKTITTIPTYYFITDSFKNWRGMQQSGGRRIKRAIAVDVNSIRLIGSEMREKFKRYQLISDYIENRAQEIALHNEQEQTDTSVPINGRQMTNVGVYRKYIENYLNNHPGINQNMTIMVRQLSNECRGVPLEIYCFTNTTAWLEYESIQSDIFDHLYATAAFFHIDIFQEPAGRDFIAAP